MTALEALNNFDIAIIGMAGRFPQAPNLDAFWQNLRDGVESISFFTEAELDALPDQKTKRAYGAKHVPAGAVIEDAEGFDAHFFGYSPLEAKVIDPQQRLFLECAWAALEDAGYDPLTCQETIGIYAGSGSSGYAGYVYDDDQVMQRVDPYLVKVSNDRDSLTNRVSYKLNLKGPSITVQTACSTSLVAVHLACQSLLSGECTLALAGGVTVRIPQKTGYYYQEGGIVSPDGHCRAFDAQASGTVSGNGLGIVVLKGVVEAVEDGDTIYALIKGSSVSNDGSSKVGFAAPGIDGQVRAIQAAHIVADMNPETIDYIETHGTGTKLGDPIEAEALTRAFQTRTSRQQFCALGSVKTNIGHLDAAAGIAGLIKTVLALKHQQIPPSLHFHRPNPEIDFGSSPFFVNHELTEWQRGDHPRRAGVSSFGMGGTNAHVILEEAPALTAVDQASTPQILPLSAKTPSALARAAQNMAAYLQKHPDLNLADAAYTLQVGRHPFECRQFVVGRDLDEAAEALAGEPMENLPTQPQVGGSRPVVFMFPGGGAQHVNMGAALYREHPLFREAIDACAAILEPLLNVDIRTIMYPAAAAFDQAASQLEQPEIGLPALFAVEYALAALWIKSGIRPSALIGHSLGEYSAACIAGVMSLEEALTLVTRRAKLLNSLPTGCMLTVALPEEEVEALLPPGMSLAAVNGPHLSVVSGPVALVEELEPILTEQQVDYRRLNVSVAAHSALVEPILDDFAQFLDGFQLQAPSIPWVSNVTGTWITEAEAANPAYWVRHLRQTVQFQKGMGELLQDSDSVLLEVGPGRMLTVLADSHPDKRPQHLIYSSLPHPKDPQDDYAYLLTALGQLWREGADVNWASLHEGQHRRRVPLPTYPFEHQPYSVTVPGLQEQMAEAQADEAKAAALDVSGQPDDQPASAPETAVHKSGLHQRPQLRTRYVAPRNELEQTLTAVWAHLFDLEKVGVHDNFFELGGHSLLASRLIAKLRDTFQTDLSLKLLYEAPTIAALAQALDKTAAAEEGPAAEAPQPAAVPTTPTLPPSTTAAPLVQWPTLTAVRAIFLTGATGYLGAFLLDEILRRTQAQVYCLVRATDEENGRGRIEAVLDAYRLENHQRRHRIIPVVGDLAQPYLGLSVTDFERLAGEVEVIYHAGAWVHFTYPYEMLKGANVDGTREVLRLAATVQIKPLHHLSTIAVFSGPESAGKRIKEDDPIPEDGTRHHTDYARSKLEAEHVLAEAHSWGVPVSIYRLGPVAGHSQSGVSRVDDYIWRMLKGCIQLGCAPDRDSFIYLLPVDYICQVILYLSMRAESQGHAFHLVDTSEFTWNDLFAWVQSKGYPLRRVPYEAWRAELLEQATPENALYPLLALFSEQSSPPALLDASNVWEGIEGSALDRPVVDNKLLMTYWSYFVETNFLARPMTPVQ